MTAATIDDYVSLLRHIATRDLPGDDTVTTRREVLRAVFAERDRLAEALRKLANEVAANTGAFERTLRKEIGHTNFAVLEHRVQEARAALQPRPQRSEATEAQS